MVDDVTVQPDGTLFVASQTPQPQLNVTRDIVWSKTEEGWLGSPQPLNPFWFAVLYFPDGFGFFEALVLLNQASSRAGGGIVIFQPKPAPCLDMREHGHDNTGDGYRK